MAHNHWNNRGGGACGGGGGGGAGGAGGAKDEENKWKNHTPFGWKTDPCSKLIQQKMEEHQQEKSEKNRRWHALHTPKNWEEKDEQMRKKKEKEDEEYAQKMRQERWDWEPEKKY